MKKIIITIAVLTFPLLLQASPKNTGNIERCNQGLKITHELDANGQINKAYTHLIGTVKNCWWTKREDESNKILQDLRDRGAKFQKN